MKLVLRWMLALLLPAGAYWAMLTEPWERRTQPMVLRTVPVPRPPVEPVPSPLPKTLEQHGY